MNNKSGRFTRTTEVFPTAVVDSRTHRGNEIITGTRYLEGRYEVSRAECNSANYDLRAELRSRFFDLIVAKMKESLDPRTIKDMYIVSERYYALHDTFEFELRAELLNTSNPEKKEMGYYINPTNMSKKAWIETYGKLLTKFLEWDSLTSELPVCLIESGPITTLAIAYSQTELKEFLKPDPRKKTWYLVNLEHLIPYMPRNWHPSISFSSPTGRRLYPLREGNPPPLAQLRAWEKLQGAVGG